MTVQRTVQVCTICWTLRRVVWSNHSWCHQGWALISVFRVPTDLQKRGNNRPSQDDMAEKPVRLQLRHRRNWETRSASSVQILQRRIAASVPSTPWLMSTISTLDSAIVHWFQEKANCSNILSSRTGACSALPKKSGNSNSCKSLRESKTNAGARIPFHTNRAISAIIKTAFCPKQIVLSRSNKSTRMQAKMNGNSWRGCLSVLIDKTVLTAATPNTRCNFQANQ